MYKKDYLNKRTFAKEFKMLDKNHENFIILTADHVEDSLTGVALNLNQKYEKNALWIPSLLGAYIKFLADDSHLHPSDIIKMIIEMTNFNSKTLGEPLIYNEKDKTEILDYLAFMEQTGSDD